MLSDLLPICLQVVVLLVSTNINHFTSEHVIDSDMMMRQVDTARSIYKRCGVIALARLLAENRSPLPFRQLEAEFQSLSEKGVNFGEIADVARSHGLQIVVADVPMKALLATGYISAIALMDDRSHVFLVHLSKSNRDHISIWDPGTLQEYKMTYQDFAVRYCGTAILAGPNDLDIWYIVFFIAALLLTSIFVLQHLKARRLSTSVSTQLTS